MCLRRLSRAVPLDDEPIMRVLPVTLGAGLVITFVGSQFGNYLNAEGQYWCIAILARALALRRQTEARGAPRPGAASVNGLVRAGPGTG